MKVEMAVLEYCGDKDAYLKLIDKIKGSGLEVAYILACDDAQVVKEAVEVLKDARPMVYGATKENYKDMIEVVKGASLPLGVKSR